jgi:hypothetical protein
MPTVRARGSDVAIQRLEARGSQEQIEHDIALALAETSNALEPARDSPPRMRMAAGTSPIENVSHERPSDERSVNTANHARALVLPPAPEAASLSFVRVMAIALCLFGLGFLGALVIWSL